MHQVSITDNQKLQRPSVATPSLRMPFSAEAESEGVILISDDERCENDDGDENGDEDDNEEYENNDGQAGKETKEIVETNKGHRGKRRHIHTTLACANHKYAR
jgi:hypothetical protein